MKLYLTAAGIYAGTQKEAGKGHTLEEVPTDKYGLIDYLNGKKFPALTPQGLTMTLIEDDIPLDYGDAIGKVPNFIPATEPSKLSPASQASIDMDEAFDKLPLARQLHFAAVAMENARAKL